jgi:dihydroorotase
MMYDLVFKNAVIVNEGRKYTSDLAVKDGVIVKIESQIQGNSHTEIECVGKLLLPGVIDDQVHFREPGLTHKAEIATESRAAVAGGTTSFMEMPNTVPQAVTIEELEKKYSRAAQVSPANYSFFMGATNSNIDELLKVNKAEVCGVKIFMGSSTGNMLVDDEASLNAIFGNCDLLIATHCEDEALIRKNEKLYRDKFGVSMPFKYHPEIRSDEACYLSSSFAVDLARKHNARLHILHISTEKELALFTNAIPLADKRITTEVCVHHLTFSASDYDKMGSKIKCNPAIKYDSDRHALWQALNDDRLDIIATDHAPHTIEEKANPYFSSPSGLPLVQHSLLQMLDFVKAGKISLERMVEKMCHAPANCFGLLNRGFVKEGYAADLVVIDQQDSTLADKNQILYKCGWSPFEGKKFGSKIQATYVNGQLVFDGEKVMDITPGERLKFKA